MTLNSYLEDTVISIYKVNLMTDFAKTLSRLQEGNSSKGESASNDKAPALTEEDHSTPEPKSPHEMKWRVGKKSRRGKSFHSRK